MTKMTDADFAQTTNNTSTPVSVPDDEHHLKKHLSWRLYLKLFLEFMPLGLFFIFTSAYDVYVGTAVLMGATVFSTALVWWIYRRLAWMALITAGTGLAAGALTLGAQDPLYVKLKPTIVSLIFAAILLGGLPFDKPLLEPLLGEDLRLTHQGWRKMTLRWGLYFVGIAILNEVVWRGALVIWPAGPCLPNALPACVPDSAQADEYWAAFKAFVLMPLTILYGLMQVPLLKRHRRPPEPEEA